MVLWVPGGAPEALRRLMSGPDRTSLDDLRGTAPQARLVASVCEGALLLAAAGLLDGYEAMTHWAFIPDAERLRIENGDPQFLDLRGVWKDTIFTKQDYEVVMRTRYERYIGEYVLHCHILDHEDQGMMQNVRIGLPETFGPQATAAAGGHPHR